MEKYLGLTHVCPGTKKSFKLLGDNYNNQKKSTGRNTKALQSTSTNVSNKFHDNYSKNVFRRHDADGITKKEQKPSTNTVKSLIDPEKIFYMKNSLEARSSYFPNGSGEGYQKRKLNSEKVKKSRSKSSDEMQKCIFTNEWNDKTELMLQKKYLKSMIMQSDLENDMEFDNDAKELSEKKNSPILSPKSIFTKCSNHVLRGKGKSQNNTKIEQAPNSHHGNSNFNSKSLMKQDKNDYSDEGGMSYLMKKYLQSSDEEARKISKPKRMPQSTKQSSTQTILFDNPERKIIKTKKAAFSMQRPKSGNFVNAGNIFTKLKSLKKN